MKQTRLNYLSLFLIFLIGGGMLFSSCSKDKGSLDVDNILGGDGDATGIILGTDNVTVSNRGGEKKIDFTSGVSWKAESNSDWIVLQNSEGEKGKVSITFNVPENDGEERSGKIVITSNPEGTTKEVAVTQESGISEDFFVKTEGTGEGHSWNDATSLSKALKNVVGGGTIHIAAGVYHPTDIINQGDPANDGDLTFEISKNITIIGGYAANAGLGDSPDPQNNKTILSGEIDNGNVYHVVTITAPVEEDGKVVVQGLTIQDGIANAGANLTINDLVFRRNNAGGLNIGGSRVDLIEVDIVNNQNASGHGSGVYVSQGADVRFTRCKINNNGDIDGNTSNAGGLYVDHATVYLFDSEVKNNEARGVASGIYGYPNANIYIYNTEIANNTSRSYGGGVYLRESQGVIVNSLIHGNRVVEVADRGGSGIMLYGSSKIDVISTTVTANESLLSAGAGIRKLSGDNKIKIYNSIVSGNLSENDGPDIDAGDNSEPEIFSSVIGTKAFDASGGEVSGISFDYSSMLNGLFLPVGGNNPAFSSGMDAVGLTNMKNNYDPVLDDRVEADLNGNSRSGKNIMGALVQ